MPLARANAIDLFYDEIGDAKAPALLLIMGLGTQMIGWPEAFCGRLADRGFRVIRFDNRDIGLSTKIENAPKTVERRSKAGATRAGRRRPVDAARRPAPDEREASIQFGMNVYKVIGSPGYPSPESELRAKVERAFDRSYYLAGYGRQLAAVLATGSRVELLKTIRVPTLLLHGADDPLIPVAAGRDTARHIPGAALKIIPGWGHDIPTALIPTLVEAITAHCERADRAAAA